MLGVLLQLKLGCRNSNKQWLQMEVVWKKMVMNTMVKIPREITVELLTTLTGIRNITDR